MQRKKAQNAHGIGRTAIIGQSLYARIPTDVVKRAGLKGSMSIAVGSDGEQVYFCPMEWGKVIKRVKRSLARVKKAAYAAAVPEPAPEKGGKQ